MAKINRSAKDGKFVTAKKAKRNPKTTVKESVVIIEVIKAGVILKRNKDYTYNNGVITLKK